MRINVAVPEAHVSKPILDASLEGVTRLNEALIESGVPTFAESVNRVRWRPEPPGQEHFDHAGIVLGRGWGDCDDLAPWHAASLRATGEDPEARAVVKRSGAQRWHAVVQRSNGAIDDPSREAGMGQPRGVVGAVVPVMYADSNVVGSYIARPQLAVRPVRNGYRQIESWQARADLPWHWQPGNSPGDVAMVSLHESPTASQAIAGACAGAWRLGAESGYVDEDALDRVAAINAAAEGWDWDEIAGEFGDDHADAAMHVVGSLFGGLAKLAKKGLKVVSSPIARRAISFIPGVGPAAATALEYGAPLLRGGKKRKRVRAPARGGMPGMPGPRGAGGPGWNMRIRCVPY